MNKYTTGSFSSEIGVVECVSETAKTCIILQPWGKAHVERKVLKMTEYVQYHDSWADAHAFLIERYTSANDRAVAALSKAQQELIAVRDMKEPKA